MSIRLLSRKLLRNSALNRRIALKSFLIKSVPRKLSAVITALMILIVPRTRAIIDVTLQMQLGNPSGATTDPSNHNHYLIQRSVETLDYSDALGEPVWASWDLTTGDVGGSGRSPNFFTDTNLPAGFYEVTDNDYNGVGNINFNRGHMCPSEDRTDNTTDNDMVFFMSNIIPQAADNNQGAWASFEDYCRSLTNTSEILIICGPSGFPTNRIPSGKAVIANYTWKIAVIVPLGGGTALSRITASTRVISLKLPNSNSISTTWQNYITSASQIEQDTGFTFFTALPTAVASALRSKVDGQTNPAPSISNFSPTNGVTNASVIITGLNFGSASAVAFNGVSAAYNVDSATQITTMVPANASSGAISVTTPGGTATSSSSFTVISSGAPSIGTQPQGLNVATGSNATFQVSASGSATLTYQWKLGGTNISGATLTSYTRTNVQIVDIGNYSVAITNGAGNTTSSNAFLNVGTPPGLASQPTNLSVNAGVNATFTSTATGDTPLIYQWKFNGTVISGATTNSYTVLNAQATNAGNYAVLVTNLFGTALSSNAALSVTGGGGGGGINATNVVISQVYGGGGNASASYQNDFVELYNPLPAAVDVSTWSVQYASAAGNSWSANKVNLTGSIQPYHYYLIKMFSQAVVGLPLPGADVTSSINMSASNGKVALVNNQTALTGNNPIGTGGVVDFVGYGTADAFEGAAAALSPPTTTNSIVRKNGGSTDSNSNSVDFVVISPPTPRNSSNSNGVTPAISGQPQSTNIIAGSNATFSVTASGTPAVSYQWQLATTNLPNATNATLTLTNVNPGQAGTYRVVVSNSISSIASSNAVLGVYATAAASLDSPVRSASQFQLNVTGVPGYNYAVQASTNLGDWLTLRTNAAPFSFADTNAASFPMRYYRTVYLP